MKKLEKVTIGTNVSRLAECILRRQQAESIRSRARNDFCGQGSTEEHLCKSRSLSAEEQKKAYTSLLKGKGQKKSVKIK